MGGSGMTNGGTKEFGTWEAQLHAKEADLKKREEVVAAAESRMGVRRRYSPADAWHACSASADVQHAQALASCPDMM